MLGHGAAPIIRIFFDTKHQLRNMKQAYCEIEKWLRKYGPYTYFFVFPELMRFLRNDN